MPFLIPHISEIRQHLPSWAWLVLFKMEPAVPSRLLGMIRLHPFKDWVVLHHAYRPHFPDRFISWWILDSISCSCSNKLGCADVSSTDWHHFPWVYIQQQGVLYHAIVLFILFLETSVLLSTTVLLFLLHANMQRFPFSTQL